MEPIRLSTNEAKKIKSINPCIGQGVDGEVYKVSNNEVYKFYKNKEILIDNNALYDEDGVNINDFKNLRSRYIKVNNAAIKYIDKEGVSLAREEAIKKAIIKQDRIQMTHLPQNIIYVNNKAAGCVYKYYPNKFGIYAAAYLPFKVRLTICERLLAKVKELVDNNIYPVTLAQKNELLPFSSDNANVLLGLKLDPIIIDLDGISAMYTEKFSQIFYNNCLSSLTALILEIITRVEINYDMLDEYEIDELINELVKTGLSREYIQKYIDSGHLDFDELNSSIKCLKKNK